MLIESLLLSVCTVVWLGLEWMDLKTSEETKRDGALFKLQETA